MYVTTDTRAERFRVEALPHLEAVYRFAMRLAGDPMLAEDLVQDTMLKAYRSWDRFRSGTNALAWLLTILRNTFVSDYRRRRRRGPVVELGEVEETAAWLGRVELNPETDFLDRTVDREVLRCIDALPVGYRETLVLSDIEGLTYAEVAAVMDLPVGTVKSRLFRARQTLKRQLYDYAVEMGYLRKRTEVARGGRET